MESNKTKRLVAKIVRLAENRGLRPVTNYSGRFMFGQTCVGVIGENTECAALARIVTKKTGFGSRYDTMGKDEMVYYFPSINTTDL
jgi:hypothetical protein